MSDTHQKLDDLLAMGFIQPDEHAARLAAIEPSAASAPAAQPPHAQPQVQTTAAHSAKRFCKLELCESGCAQEQVRMGASHRSENAWLTFTLVTLPNRKCTHCSAMRAESSIRLVWRPSIATFASSGTIDRCLAQWLIAVCRLCSVGATVCHTYKLIDPIKYRNRLLDDVFVVARGV